MDILKQANELNTITNKEDFCHRLMDVKQAWGVIQLLQINGRVDSQVTLATDMLKDRNWSTASVLEYLEALFRDGAILPNEQDKIVNFRNQCEEELRIHDRITVNIYSSKILEEIADDLKQKVNAAEVRFGELFPDSGLKIRLNGSQVTLSYRCRSTTKRGEIFQHLCLLLETLKPGTPYSPLDLDWRGGSLEDKLIKEQFRQAVLSFNAVCKEELHIEQAVLAYDGKNNQISRRYV